MSPARCSRRSRPAQARRGSASGGIRTTPWRLVGPVLWTAAGAARRRARRGPVICTERSCGYCVGGRGWWCVAPRGGVEQRTAAATTNHRSCCQRSCRLSGRVGMSCGSWAVSLHRMLCIAPVHCSVCMTGLLLRPGTPHHSQPNSHPARPRTSATATPSCCPLRTAGFSSRQVAVCPGRAHWRRIDGFAGGASSWLGARPSLLPCPEPSSVLLILPTVLSSSASPHQSCSAPLGHRTHLSPT